MGLYPRGKEPACPAKLPGCLGKLKERTARMCAACYNTSRRVAAPADPPVDRILKDRQQKQEKADLAGLKHAYEDSLARIDLLEKELSARNILRGSTDTFVIKPTFGSGTSEATVVAPASDWHVEENVGAEVGGLNRYSLDIAKQRATKYFQGVLRLTNLLGQDVRIKRIVLPLLGDFITNDIHDELVDLTETQPIYAILEAKRLLASGIKFLLAESPYELLIICHSGNHGRTTHTTHFSAENGHSLEYFMYDNLADIFKDEPRVQFVIPDGYHSYVQVYDQTIRFHHGHAIKYGGGVGGIYIPVNKAIAQWNKGKHADLDVFGHFHQMRDGGNFICNGSLIGYNGFALSIKADYEKPKQALFLIDKRRGRTCTWPVLVE